MTNQQGAPAAPAAVAGPKEAVAYLDIGEGGYLDLGSDLSDEALRKLPKGRHMLAIVGTYGVDGYVPVAAPTTQATPQPAAQQGDELPREDFAWLVVQEACETEPADEDDPECIRILRRDLKSAVLSAFIRHDAAHPAAPVAQGDGAEPVAYLWQHSETGRTRVVMPDAVITTDASWRVIGPLFLAAHPAAPVAQGDAPTDSGPISRQWLTVVYRGVKAGDEVQQICTHPKVSAMSWSHALHDRDVARSQAKEG